MQQFLATNLLIINELQTINYLLASTDYMSNRVSLYSPPIFHHYDLSL